MGWVHMALGGAICTSLTTILAKIGIKDVNSNFATSFVRFENFAIVSIPAHNALSAYNFRYIAEIY